MQRPQYVRWFGELRSEDVALVGGKNASLGELYSAVAAGGVRVLRAQCLGPGRCMDDLARPGGVTLTHGAVDASADDVFGMHNQPLAGSSDISQ